METSIKSILEEAFELQSSSDVLDIEIDQSSTSALFASNPSSYVRAKLKKKKFIEN